jgi:hypothetical protein
MRFVIMGGRGYAVVRPAGWMLIVGYGVMTMQG